MVVFHTWFWERCLVYLTVLLLPGLNKEHLEPAWSPYIYWFISFFFNVQTSCVKIITGDFISGLKRH